MKAKTTSSPTLNTPRKIRDFTREVILVRVKKSFWDGKMGSDKAADAAAAAEHAKRDRVEARIIAIERKYLAPVSAPMYAMSTLLRSKSRPWRDGGWRMMFTADYTETRAALDKLQIKVRDGVQTVVKDKYDEIKRESEKDLNGYLDGRFPTRERMLERYDVKILTDVVSSIEDCRLSGMSAAEVEQVMREREETLLDGINEGNRVMVRELSKTIETLHEKLADDSKTFHGCEEGGYPIFDNVSALLDQCERFNITQDEKLAASIASARAALKDIDMTQCKSDKLARKSAAKSVKTVMDDLLSF